jgi:GT2 family glycosyltransferase
MPAFRSGETIERSLASVSRQTLSDFEFVLVESGPEPVGSSTLETYLPKARYIYSEGVLLPNAALNRGIAQTSAETLVFLDPDTYAHLDWLERLLSARDEGHPILVGGVACYGNRWVAQGAHMAKFDKWLPGIPAREIREGPTANFLVDRSIYNRYGPFVENLMHADTTFCWRLRSAGEQIWTAPEAVVEHHHLQPWGALLRERYRRGLSFAREFPVSPGGLRSDRRLHLLVSLLPVRLFNQLVRVHRNATSARQHKAFWMSLPVTASLLYAWLWGEAMAGLRSSRATV